MWHFVCSFVADMARIAMPVGDEFEDAEVTVPWERLRAAQHEVTIVGSEKGATVRGKRGHATVRVDVAAASTDPREFDALVIPGGHSPDHLRLDAGVVSFVRRFWETGKTVAAVCHGPQLLIEADVVRGKTLTSWPSIRKDLENAGARWIDRQVVEDGNLITSRKPDDLEAFSAAILRRLERAEARPSS
jgi:protease I